MKNPRQGDWVSSVLNDLNSLDIHEDIEEIGIMKKEKFSLILNDRIEALAFKWLLDKKKSRKSENAKGKDLKYSFLQMAEYLGPTSNASINEKKWLLKCRLEDINVKANRRWQFDNLICSSCDTNNIESQSHILECKTLIGQCEIVTYLPNYRELFEDDVEAQIYVSRIMRDNHRRIQTNQTM